MVEPAIAIVGMSFRFPGDLSSEDAFWQALVDGRDLVTEIDADRWATDTLYHPRRSEPGRSVTFSAGVLSRLDQFDAAFFGISPREATHLDPQQRLLLEMSWEAMENGGLPPDRLAGSDCAVFVGVSGLDYGFRGLDDLSGMNAHSMTGNVLSFAANRLSYVFDLRGPSMAVDSACSSSLVALHQACGCLRQGEASMALVGGINLLLHPYPFVGFTKASMLSARGRCRTFDASADGYVRAEGGAVLLLKPLDRAEADRDDIRAVILATGSNADGARKSGITIPSAQGQAELLRRVLDRAGVAPAEVDYVEAHGTGTAVGDPIETHALGEVLGRNRAMPLPVGSVKSNLGHLEPASGMAGLVKTVLALGRRALPPSIHLHTPNPHIDLADLNLEVVTRYRELPDPGRPLRMGVNSFGFGGANAHVLLEEYRGSSPAAEPTDPSAAPPLFLSARSPAALRELARLNLALLADPETPEYYDVAYAAAHHRQWLEKRLAVRGADRAEVCQRLDAWSQGGSVAGVVEADALPESGPAAFIYSGNGAQWLGMGRRLLRESAAFGASLEEVDGWVAHHAGFSVAAELAAEAAASRLEFTEVAQPCLFAVQVGVTRLLCDHGMRVAFAAGHSVGEVAAAWAVGALDLEQAVQVICQRSASQALTKGSGRMAAVGLAEAAAREAVQSSGFETAVEIAGINSPGGVTLSGSLAALEALCAHWGARGVFCRLLDLDYAFHSQAMEPAREPLLHHLRGLAPRCGDGRFFSTVTGGELAGDRLDAEYWWSNVRQPVRFDAAIAALAEAGCRVFVEIGPHAILQRYVTESLGARHVAGRALPSLRKEDDGLDRVAETALMAGLLGAPLDLGPHFPRPGRRVRLPNYPWQRERFWGQQTDEGYDLINRRPVHPLLGVRLKDAAAVWESVLDIQVLPYLADHQVGGAVVLPGAAYAEMALAASRAWYGCQCHEVEEMAIVAPVVMDSDHGRVLRFELDPTDGGFRILSRPRLGQDDWSLNATGRLLGEPQVTPPSGAVPVAPLATEGLDRSGHYALAGRVGLDYGPAFQGLEHAWSDGDNLLVRLSPPQAIEASLEAHILHPALLDVCFQSLLALFAAEIEAGQGSTLVPVAVRRLRFYGGVPAWCTGRLVRKSPRSILADFRLLDVAGQCVAQLEGYRAREAVLGRKGPRLPALWKHEFRLQPHPRDAGHAPVNPGADLVDRVRRALAEPDIAGPRQAHFQRTVPLLNALVCAFAWEVLQELTDTGSDGLAEAAGEPGTVVDAAQPLFAWLCDRLQAEGMLHREGGTWRLVRSNAPPSAVDIWRAILADSPEALPDLLRIGRVGMNLPHLLSGRMDAAAFGDALARSPLAAQYHDSSPTYAGLNQAAQEFVALLSADWPTDRRLRVLEVVGGSEDLHRRLLPLLPAGRCDYVLAADDEDRRARLAAEYAAHPAVRVARIEAAEGLTLDGQATPAECFDLVLVHHWLHRVAHITPVLAALRTWLAQDGLLWLQECHPDGAADLVNGLDPGWWHPAGDGRHASSLLSPANWSAWLTQEGYVDLQVLREPAGEDLETGVFAVLARNPDEGHGPAGPPGQTWLLLADETGPSRPFMEDVAIRLRGANQKAVVAFGAAAASADGLVFDPASEPSCRALLDRVVNDQGGCDHLVHGLGLGALSPGDDVPELQERRCVAALHWVHALADRAPAAPRLWLVTAGGAPMGQPVPGWCPQPDQAPLWGFGRVVMNEHPELRSTLLDLAPELLTGEGADRLAVELVAPDGEEEIVLTRAGRFVPRMVAAESPAALAATPAATGYRLDFAVPGQLRNLYWRPLSPRNLATDDVEIRPVAVGLNFRDVMYAMGLLADEAVESGFSGASLGLELAGRVTRVGHEVNGLKPGDEVVAFAPACFASHVVTKAGSVVVKPEAWSFAQAATVPTVFFTVYYALKHLADVQPGERVLIHGAAGGVGIAALQVARWLGAEVFATAGSDEKRDFVRLLGADHVMDSRTLAYADEILAITGGLGVDVVLNSLAGEAIQRNLRALRPFGRFLELGKRDFYENTRIGLRPFKDNISYFGIDADQLMVARPALAYRLFREVMDLFTQGILRPLPYRVFPAERIVDAFRHMQQSRQIGKIVVTIDDSRVPVRQPQGTQLPAAPTLSRDATYLVTGGTDGFGLKSAAWLARLGAGHLVLLGRRGPATPGLEATVADIEALGARVHVYACDVSDRPSLAAVLAQVRCDLPPLRGVVHAAMVLDDGLVRNLDALRLHRVLAPKVQGAWHLHQLTLDLPLDLFIVYSSATTTFGNPGQASYVAANLFLESLVSHRRAAGLAGTSICWGAIGDVGYLTRHAAVKDTLQVRLGGQALESDQALALLGAILSHDQDGLAVMDFDWSTLERLLPGARSHRYDELRRSATHPGANLEQVDDIRVLIAGRTPQEVRELVAGLLTGEVAQVLQLPPERIDPTRSLYDLGMDSLMGVELVLGIEKRFGIRLPVMALNEGPSVERIAERVAALLTGDRGGQADEGTRFQELVSGMAAQHGEELSPQQMAEAVVQVAEQAREGVRVTP